MRRTPSNTTQRFSFASRQSISSFNCSGVKPLLMIWMVFRFMTEQVFVGFSSLYGSNMMIPLHVPVVRTKRQITASDFQAIPRGRRLVRQVVGPGCVLVG